MDRPRERWEPSQRNREYLSFFADEAPRALKGRQPIQCYTDFMRSFRDNFLADLGSNIEEVVVGTGPCGELRYPSYPEANGWRFPGVRQIILPSKVQAQIRTSSSRPSCPLFSSLHTPGSCLMAYAG